MLRRFDADALLAALPKTSIRSLGEGLAVRSGTMRAPPQASALGETGEYNGFSGRKGSRTAGLSNWLTAVGCTEGPRTCDCCSAPADDKHAENYYDLGSWIGLCRRCHRSLLHGRFLRPGRWRELLNRHEVPAGHRAGLVSDEPFDLAALLRSRGSREPVRRDFVAS